MLIKKTDSPPVKGLARIPIGLHLYAIVDASDYPWLSQFHWHLLRSFSCFYAARRKRHNGKDVWIKMHRMIANAPPGYEVHHINHNTLDNRRENLELVTPREHRTLHNKV